jgi:hypothetical protein
MARDLVGSSLLVFPELDPECGGQAVGWRRSAAAVTSWTGSSLPLFLSLSLSGCFISSSLIMAVVALSPKFVLNKNVDTTMGC